MQKHKPIVFLVLAGVLAYSVLMMQGKAALADHDTPPPSPEGRCCCVGMAATNDPDVARALATAQIVTEFVKQNPTTPPKTLAELTGSIYRQLR